MWEPVFKSQIFQIRVFIAEEILLAQGNGYGSKPWCSVFHFNISRFVFSALHSYRKIMVLTYPQASTPEIR
jgi:hypothetical protein